MKTLIMTPEQWLDALAEAWQAGWDARAKYIGTNGNHFPGRNPYRVTQTEEPT